MVKEIVKELWEKGSVEYGTSSGRIRVKKLRAAGKGLVAEAVLSQNCRMLAYYPKPEHAEKFAETSKYLERGGPSGIHPGSVGTLCFVARGREYFLQHVQSSFKQREPELSRSLATRYGGWRKHLFDELFGTALKNGVLKVSYTAYPKQWGGMENYAEFFAKSAKEHGFEVEFDEMNVPVLRRHYTATRDIGASLSPNSLFPRKRP